MIEADYNHARELQTQIGQLEIIEGILEDNSYYPIFHSDTCNRTPSVEIEDPWLAEELRQFIKSLLIDRKEEFEKL